MFRFQSSLWLLFRTNPIESYLHIEIFPWIFFLKIDIAIWFPNLTTIFAACNLILKNIRITKYYQKFNSQKK